MEDMIRLTEEEIAEVMGLPYPLEELEHENYAVVDIYDLHPLVKAQVKKFTEMPVIDCYGGNKLILAKDWQALLEEVK